MILFVDCEGGERDLEMGTNSAMNPNNVSEQANPSLKAPALVITNSSKALVGSNSSKSLMTSNSGKSLVVSNSGKSLLVSNSGKSLVLSNSGKRMDMAGKKKYVKQVIHIWEVYLQV